LDTSLEAYESVKPRINALHAKVIAAVQARGGATASEVMDDTGVIYNTVWRRMSELKQLGILVNTDQKRRNSRGRNEVVVGLAA
jgi:predicted HTH transcriptional regulator